MEDKDYKKRLEEWMKTHKGQERKVDTPYIASKMQVRAPLGCILATIALVLGLIYIMGSIAGRWKGLF